MQFEIQPVITKIKYTFLRVLYSSFVYVFGISFPFLHIHAEYLYTEILQKWPVVKSCGEYIWYTDPDSNWAASEYKSAASLFVSVS
jgi:hypothetical protein